ncbi:MAG: glycoside hydrolase family 99-like domain-containing protein [Desulfovibrionaceae bacterium]|nr:glycoside hydrolase family 99-like domain-containing protein [Desulfovibrionaceae bacterium]
MKIFAFYLPQYHVIEENECIYGKGFTEWDNVRNARPLFQGHYQPHIPHKILGYYSLLDKDFIEEQHRLAFNFSVKGFCYYYYNFCGKILLDKPLKIINTSKSIENEFCLCWCHGSWYNNKKIDKEIFIKQDYSMDKVDSLTGDLLQYFYNERYLKIDNKPVLIICSPNNIPNAKDYISAIRNSMKSTKFKDIMLAGLELFGGCQPSELGLDFMIEYAPNWVDYAFLGKIHDLKIYDYQKAIEFNIKKEKPNYNRIRCTFPGWDNTPRKKDKGIVFIDEFPEVFEASLKYLKTYTEIELPKNMQYIFVNAWNEWGEGCHIEPDQKYGFTYLEIIKRLFGE